MNEVIVTVCARAVHVLMHVCVACDAWGVPRGCLGVCLVCAWHGIEDKMDKVCKTHKH